MHNDSLIKAIAIGAAITAAILSGLSIPRWLGKVNRQTAIAVAIVLLFIAIFSLFVLKQP